MMRRARRGANAMEFALLLPVFLALTSLIFDYAWYLFTVGAAEMAVVRGCRLGARLDPDVADVRGIAKVEMTDWMELSALDCASAGCGVWVSGAFPTQELVCGVVIDYQPLVGLAPTPDRIQRESAALMMYQR